MTLDRCLVFYPTQSVRMDQNQELLAGHRSRKALMRCGASSSADTEWVNSQPNYVDLDPLYIVYIEAPPHGIPRRIYSPAIGFWGRGVARTDVPPVTSADSSTFPKPKPTASIFVAGR